MNLESVPHPNKDLMALCFAEAKAAAQAGEYSIAALVACGDRVLSKEHTSLHSRNDPTAHAEILAIRKAAEVLDSRHLEGCYLYTTCEPCPMCTAAAIFARMRGIIYSANQIDALRVFEKRNQASHDWRQIPVRARYLVERSSPRLEIHEDFLREEGLFLLDLT